MGVTPRWLGLIAAGAAFAIDQGNKFWMLEAFRIEDMPPIKVLPFLDIVMVWNPGISYGLFRADAPAGRWTLLAVTLLVTMFFSVWLWRSRAQLTAVGLGLIVGAALANAFDRFMYGAVADFYHFHTPFSLGPLSNYVFNLADVAIVAGVALLLYESIANTDQSDPATDV